MLGIITALLLPACMVTAHAVDHTAVQGTSLAAHASQPDALLTAINLVDDALSLTGDAGEAVSRRLLAAKKKKKTNKTNKAKNQAKKKAKRQAKKEKKKAKKQARKFKWKGRGKNGLKFKSNRPKGIFKNGEIVYNADGIKCAAKKKETDQIAFSQSAELHATAGMPPPPPLLLLHPNIGVHKPPCMESHDAYKSSASLINCSPLPPPCSSSGKSADMCIIICRPGPYIHPVSKHSCILDDTTTKLSDLHARLSIQLSLHPILITTASPSAYNVAAQDIIM